MAILITYSPWSLIGSHHLLLCLAFILRRETSLSQTFVPTNYTCCHSLWQAEQKGIWKLMMSPSWTSSCLLSPRRLQTPWRSHSRVSSYRTNSPLEWYQKTRVWLKKSPIASPLVKDMSPSAGWEWGVTMKCISFKGKINQENKADESWTKTSLNTVSSYCIAN